MHFILSNLPNYYPSPISMWYFSIFLGNFRVLWKFPYFTEFSIFHFLWNFPCFMGFSMFYGIFHFPFFMDFSMFYGNFFDVIYFPYFFPYFVEVLYFLFISSAVFYAIQNFADKKGVDLYNSKTRILYYKIPSC